MTLEIRPSSTLGTIGTEEQERQDDSEGKAVKTARVAIQEILDGSSSKMFWIDTRSILSALSSEGIQFPASLRRFHNRTTWVHLEHRTSEVRGSGSETWKMKMDSISGQDYPKYEFSSTEGESHPTILEEITDRDGKEHKILRTGIAAPSDLPLITAALGFVKEGVNSDKLHSSQIE